MERVTGEGAVSDDDAVVVADTGVCLIAGVGGGRLAVDLVLVSGEGGGAVLRVLHLVASHPGEAIHDRGRHVLGQDRLQQGEPVADRACADAALGFGHLVPLGETQPRQRGGQLAHMNPRSRRRLLRGELQCAGLVEAERGGIAAALCDRAGHFG